MVALTEFPDATAVAHYMLKRELWARGIDVAVATKLPSPPPERFIKCYTIVGGERCAVTQNCQVIVFVYDTDEQRCNQLARLCGQILRAAPEFELDDDQDNPVSGPCNLHGPFPNADPDVPTRERYQTNVDWVIQSA